MKFFIIIFSIALLLVIAGEGATDRMKGASNDLQIFKTHIPKHFSHSQGTSAITFYNPESIGIIYFTWLKYLYAPFVLRDAKDLKTDTCLIANIKTQNTIWEDSVFKKNILLDSFSHNDIYFYLLKGCSR